MKMRRSLSLLLALLMVMLVFAGCGKTEVREEEVKTEEGQTEETQETTEKPAVADFNGTILFNGSSTLAPVISAIAAEYNEEYGTWDKVDPSLGDKDISIFVSSGGSGQGVKSVIEGTTDFGMVSREVKDEEKEQIPNYNEVMIGVDALTITVNPANKIADDLTKEDIMKIFSGEYKKWSDIDPALANEEIIVITRDVNGGAHGVFQKAIMGDVQVKEDAIQAASMGELVQNVIDNPNAIGYGSYGVVNQNAGKVRTIKVEGVEANQENIVNKSYPIQRPLLIVSSGEPNPAEQKFIDLLLSEEGQGTIEKMGFVPVK